MSAPQVDVRVADAAAERLLEMGVAYLISKAISLVAKLGIPDLVGEDPRDIEDLARCTGTLPHHLGRLIRMLAGVGVFTLDGGGRVGLGPLGGPLRDGASGSIRSLLAMAGEEGFRAAAELETTLRTGAPGFEQVYGAPLYDWFDRHPAVGAVFDRAMADRHKTLHRALANAIDLSGAGWLVDVGGGRGQLAASLVERHPGLRVTVLDRPRVVASAPDIVDGVDFMAGDFFREVPGGADVYLVGSVLHNWDDVRARAILRACRRAMGARGTLLLVEMVVPPGNVPAFVRILDIEMMVLTAGRERTEDEHRALLAHAGLQVTRVIPTGGRLSVIEGRAFRPAPTRRA